jgi:hypothetical protein
VELPADVLPECIVRPHQQPVIRSSDFYDDLAKWTAIQMIEGIGQRVETVSGIDDRRKSMIFDECQHFFHIAARAMAHALNSRIFELRLSSLLSPFLNVARKAAH